MTMIAMMTIIPKLAPKAVSVSVSPELDEVVWFDTMSYTNRECTIAVHVAMPEDLSSFVVVDKSFLHSKIFLLLSSRSI